MPTRSHKIARRRLSYSIILIFLCLLSIAVIFGVPSLVIQQYGLPSPALEPGQQFDYSMRLLWYGEQLTQPLDRDGVEQIFTIAPGESASSIATRLEKGGIIHNAGALRTYLIYTGLDTSIQAGEHILSPAQSTIDIARSLQDVTPGKITFVILPGWRMEEIAASLLTSGLEISPEAFLASAALPPTYFDFIPASATSEGFLFPDSYILPRETTVEELVGEFLRNFSLHLTTDLREGFSRQGLDVYQAVTLASMVQREAVIPEEQPQIASVFINRLNLGMKLDSDPTVQYALGFNEVQGTWWTNPIGAEGLQIDSPYNTYIYSGLPPGPIANPSLSALQAVALPAETPYYYFRARCDGSGLHQFAVTFEEHLQNNCQ